MKNLIRLKNKLSKKEILETNESQDIKGGKRFSTKDYSKMLKKLTKLQEQGYSPTTAEHDGEYCIEW